MKPSLTPASGRGPAFRLALCVVLAAASAAPAFASSVIEEEADGQSTNDTPGTAEVLSSFFFTSGGKSETDAFGGSGSEGDYGGLLTATISGRNGGNDVDFFQFTLTTSGQAWFDMDGASFDTILALFDASGTLIAFDDDSGFGGDFDGGNSFLGSLLLGPGTYYIAVSQYSNFPTQVYRPNIFIPVSDDPGTTFIDLGTLVFGAPPDPTYGGGEGGEGGGETNQPPPFQISNVQLGATYTLHVTSNAMGPVTTPEPGSYALFGLGVTGLAGLAWRRRRRAVVA